MMSRRKQARPRALKGDEKGEIASLLVLPCHIASLFSSPVSYSNISSAPVFLFLETSDAEVGEQTQETCKCCGSKLEDSNDSKQDDQEPFAKKPFSFPDLTRNSSNPPGLSAMQFLSRSSPASPFLPHIRASVESSFSRIDYISQGRDQTVLCGHCKSTFQLRSSQVQLKDDRISVCSECRAVFPSLEERDQHFAGHFLLAQMNYACKTCGASFQKPDELQKHLMDAHAQHLYRCSPCGEVFETEVNIQVHFAIRHSNVMKVSTIFGLVWGIHFQFVFLKLSVLFDSR